MVENIREAIQRANSLQAEIGKVAVELGSLIREEAPAEDLEVIDESVEQVTDEPEQLSEPTSEEGLREDIISYLTGENDLGSVRPFTKKQLVECFRGVDALKDQPKGWRDRFARVQQANLSGKPSH